MRSALFFVFVTIAYASCYDYEYYDAATGATVGSACDGPPVRAPSPATLPGQAPTNQPGTPPSTGAFSIPPTPNAPVANQLGTLPGAPVFNAPAANPYSFSQFSSWPTSGSPASAATLSPFSGQFGAPSTSGFATTALSQTSPTLGAGFSSSTVLSPYTGSLLASGSAVPSNALPYEFPVLYGAPLGQSSQSFPNQPETTLSPQPFNSFSAPVSGPIYSSASLSSPYASILDNTGALAGPAALGPLYSAPLVGSALSPYSSSSFPVLSTPFSNTLAPISGSVAAFVPFSSEVSVASPSPASPYVAPSSLNDLYKPTSYAATDLFKPTFSFEMSPAPYVASSALNDFYKPAFVPVSSEVSVASLSPAAPYVASGSLNDLYLPANTLQAIPTASMSSALPVSTAYKATVARTVLSPPASPTQVSIPSAVQQVLVSQPVPVPVQRVLVSQPVPVPVQQVRVTQPVPIPVQQVRIAQSVPAQPARVTQVQVQPRPYLNSRGRYVQPRYPSGSAQQRFMGMSYYGPQPRYG